MKRFHLHNRFEDKLKYKVEDFELVPSDNIWNNIEAELDASKKKGKYVILASALLIIFTASGLYLGGVFDGNSNKLTDNTNNPDKIAMEQAVVNNNANENGNNGMGNTNSTEPVADENTNADNHTSTGFKGNKELPTSSPDLSFGERFPWSQRGREDAGRGTDGYAPGSKDNSLGTDGEGTYGEKADRSTDITKTEPKPSTVVATTRDERNGRNEEQVLLALTKQEILAAEKSNDKKGIKRKPTKIKKERVTNLSFGLSAAPQYSYRKFNEYESSLRSIKDFRNQTDGSIFGYTIGADVYYRLSRFVYVSSGVHFARMGENIAVAKVTDNGQNKIIAAESGRERNVYNYLDIPLTMSVRVNRNSRTKIDLKGGLIYSKLTKVNALVYDYVGEEYKSVLAKDAPQLNPDNVSVVLGINTVVPLDRNDKRLLTIGPMVRYNLMSTFADTYTAKQRNFNIGVQVSYIVRLDH